MEKEIKIYHVETQADYDDLMIKLEEQGYKWVRGGKPTSKPQYWDKTKEDTLIFLNTCGEGIITRGSSYTHACAHPHITIINYKVGDDLELETDKAKELQKYSEQIAKKKEDLVNHPAHYNQYSQEVIDTIEEVTVNMPVTVAYHVGNAVKYLFRAPFKGKLKQDLEKAVWYLERAVSKL